MALAAGYPAGKIGADTAEKICEKVEDGETDAEEIADGICHMEYKVAKINKGKPVIKPDGTYELRNTIYQKDVIDTTKRGIDEIVSMAKEAFASGKIAFTENEQKGILGTSKEGIKYVGWIDAQTDTLTSFYPVKEWPEKLLKGVK